MAAVSIRWRLTLWYGTVLALLLSGFGTVVYWMMHEYIMLQADAEATEELAEFHRELRNAPNLEALRAQLPSFFSVHREYAFELRTSAGQRLIASEEDEPLALAVDRPHQSQDIHFETRALNDRGRYRIGTRVAQGPDGTLQMAIAIPLEPYERLLIQFLSVLFTAGPALLLGAVAGGYFLARRALAPVDELRATAERITAEHLSERIDVPNPHDELGRLAGTFNGMLERLDRSFQELRRFTADAAHELRTPLAVLRSGLEIAVRTDRSPQRYREILRSAIEDVERLCGLSERLLLLAREDAGLATARRPIRLDVLLRDIVEQMRSPAETKGLTLCIGELDAMTVSGDPDGLRQLWMNLLDNAIKYTPSGGRILIRAEHFNGHVRLVVADSGIGIPPNDVPHVFDRFYRVDPSRNGGSGGAGLGLAICKAIVASHQGQIEIVSTPGQGTRVSVSLPPIALPKESH